MYLLADLVICLNIVSITYREFDPVSGHPYDLRWRSCYVEKLYQRRTGGMDERLCDGLEAIDVMPHNCVRSGYHRGVGAFVCRQALKSIPSISPLVVLAAIIGKINGPRAAGRVEGRRKCRVLWWGNFDDSRLMKCVFFCRSRSRRE